MRIGITAHVQFSIFSGMGASAVLAVAETCKLMGHSVSIVATNGEGKWWDDLVSLKGMYEVVSVNDIKEPLDILFEVATNIDNKEVRQRIAKRCIWVLHKPILLNDVEHSIFPVCMGRRNLEGLTEVWCMEHDLTEDEYQYLETLTRVPVRQVPYLWTPSLVETYRKEMGLPTWIQMTVHMTQKEQRVLPWSIHIFETNNSATSSCTIPLVILREAKLQKEFFVQKYNVHNAQQIEKSEFFKQNVYAHCQVEDLSGSFSGRQRLPDWIADPMSCVISHMRFRKLRHALLDLLWLGIPVIHNSTLIRDLGCDYEGYYYTDNSIVEGAKALTKIQRDIAEGKGMFQQGSYVAMQQKLLGMFSPLSLFVQEGWKKAIEYISNTPTIPVEIPVKPAETEKKDEEILRVLFTDMWDGFHADYNMFLLMLQEGSKNLQPRPRIEGYSLETIGSHKPNLLLFGPFGHDWKAEQWKDIPKAHFTGENTQPVVQEKVILNMGYPHADFVDEQYVRLPLWMLEIDWFGADVERIHNPKPVSIDRCMKVYPDEICQKKKFCSFVVTNPCNPVRNSAFHWLNQYKKVDSAGRLFNNIGDEIFAGLGGGGGELKKIEFLKNYKFCLAYENASSQGYTTEKLLHAKVAGCIPIYWGDPKVERDFDTKGFIDARKFASPEELIEAVRKIDENPSAYLQMYAVPALDDYKRDIVRRTFSQIAFRLLKHALPQREVKQEMIPRFLGGESEAEAKKLALERTGIHAKETQAVAIKELTNSSEKTILKTQPKNSQTVLPSNPLFITMATLRFLPALQMLLSGLKAQKQVIPNLEASVWISKDIEDNQIQSFKENFPFATFERLPEDEKVEGFEDYWAPEHFAWKLWLLHKANHKAEWKGRLVMYADAGVFISRLPKTWLQITQEEDICLLEDPRQINRDWCSSTFCSKLNVSDLEKDSQQLWAGCMAFVCGSPKSISLFDEAYKYSRVRDIIAGPKWEGMRNGKPFGHRHDQSILSIHSQRMGIVRYPMDEIYCDHSLRKTFMSGKALYVHRGAFAVHKPFAKGIDDAFVINLDRRGDRMEKLYNHNPELKDRVSRLSAFEGKQITLTPAIARLFKPHDFFWKKAILGCALSHLQLWWNLVNEKPEIESYLIMEDDVKLQKGWEEAWDKAAGYIPEDADVIYLGGILPPNRPAFELSKEKVNQYFSRVAPNQIFGQNPPNRYFHWCNYSYILTRSGAEKILQILHERDGYWTSADHMVCNRVDKLNHYFLDPLVAGCYQDDDPKYQTSAFNDFSRIDGFDSDLWNNDERFSTAEIETCLHPEDNIDIPKALQEGKVKHAPSQAEPVKPIVETVLNKDEKQSFTKIVLPLITQPPQDMKRSFVSLKEHKFDGANAYEKEWVSELLEDKLPFAIQEIELGGSCCEKPIVIVQRPHIEKYKILLEQWNDQKKDFYVFHVSDEYGKDDISFYTLPHCLGVVRIYQRADIPESVKHKVLVIPLGYHWTLHERSDDPLNKTPRLPFRNVRWSFYGTQWANRKEFLEPFKTIEPHSLKFLDSWDSPEKLSRNQYMATLLDSVFVPCPPGNNVETFRLYEALECGCLPVYVKTPGDDLYCNWLQNELGILPLSSSHEAVALMNHFWNDKDLLENYRNSILIRWKGWKQRLGEELRKKWSI